MARRGVVVDSPSRLRAGAPGRVVALKLAIVAGEASGDLLAGPGVNGLEGSGSLLVRRTADHDHQVGLEHHGLFSRLGSSHSHS